MIQVEGMTSVWVASPCTGRGEGEGLFRTNYGVGWVPKPLTLILSPWPRGEADQWSVLRVRRREIFPDLKYRLDREFASAGGAGREQLDWSPPATNVFWPGQFRARQ